VIGDASVTWSLPNRSLSNEALHPRYFSDSVQVLCGQHVNEQRKFIGKLSEAANDFSRIKREENCCHVVMMRVHPTADVVTLGKQAQLLLDTDEKCGADAFWLYQPSVAHREGQTILSHALRMAVAVDRYGLGHPISVEARYGAPGTEPTQVRLIGNGIDIQLRDHYMYQRAKQFVHAIRSPDGAISGFVRNPAPGVHISSMFDFPEGSFGLEGKFQLHDELEIL
jgi:hypothetical protein